MPAALPDGGYGWVVALCSMFIMLIQSSYFSVFGVVYMELVMYYETTKSVISWVGAILQFLFGVTGLIFGPLLRKYGPRKVGFIMPFIVTFGYVCPVFSRYLWMMFVSYALFAGIGAGCFGNIALSSVYPWFSKQRSLAISLVMTGTPLGAFIWPLLATWLNHEYSWKGTFIITGGIQLHALVFIALLRKPDVITDYQYISQDTECDPENNFKPMELAAKQDKEKVIFCGWTELCNDPSFFLLYFSTALLYFGQIVGFSYTTARGVLMGFSDTNAAILSSIVGGVSGAGRLVAGIIGDKLGIGKRKYALVTLTMTCGFSSILSMLCKQFWHMAIYCAIWGLLSGIYPVYLLASYADMFGTKYAAEMVGLYQAVAGVSFLVANILTGVMFDTTDDPSLPFTVFGGLQVIASVLVLLAIFVNKRRWAIEK